MNRPSNRKPILILAVVAVIALVAGGIFLWNAHQNAIKVVDSCGNTSADLVTPGMLEPCATVSGRVMGMTAMANGDLEVQLLPNRESSYARNTQNQGLQNGNLVIVLPCGSSADLPTVYFQTCAQFKQTYIHPASQNPVTYTGNLVINRQFGWVEMKPTLDTPGA